MELRQLRYFVATADELHFGRAAQRLHISQPALSFDIRKFETQLGVKLFTRTKKQVTLTPAGQLLLERARNLLHEANEAEQLVQQSTFGISGRLHVGFVNAMLFRGLPDAVAKFSRQSPEIEVILKEMNTEEQVSALAHHRIDLGCVHATRISDAHVASRPLLSEPFVCCLPTSHPLSGNREVALHDLADAPFICFPRTVSPHYHDRIIALCVAAGFSPWIRHEVRLWQTVITMVEYGMGVALVPRSLHTRFSPAAHFLPLSDVSGTSELYLVHRHGPEDAITQQFADILTQSVHDHMESLSAL